MADNRTGKDDRLKRQRGATAVETAILLSTFLLIIFGVMEFGLYFYQQHFITTQAKIGVRVGIRANNYECFDSSCADLTDRHDFTKGSVETSLSTLWDIPSEYTVTVSRDTDEDSPTQKKLSVAITVDNFMPELLSGFLPDAAGVPRQISTLVTGEYEDPSEP